MSIDIQYFENDSISIKRKKASVSKKYSSTRSKSIEAANELAVILFALERNDESLMLLKSYSEKSPFKAPRHERWEAACFAMLLQAHIESINENEKESERLFDRINNKDFDPANWFTESDFDEFFDSIKAGIDNVEGVTKNEKLQVRAEGVLVLLYAYYVWAKKWPKFEERASDLQQALRSELKKVALYV